MYQSPDSLQKQGEVLVVLFIVTLILSSFAQLVSAEEKANEQNGWEFQAAPCMWFISLEGNVTVRGQKSDVDTSFSDIWDELNIAGMIALDGRKGNWGFFGDTIYANLGKVKSGQRIRIDPSINVLWLTAGGFYRLGTWDLSGQLGKKGLQITRSSKRRKTRTN